MALYVGINGVAKKCVNLYAGVNGTAKRVKTLYSGMGGSLKKSIRTRYSTTTPNYTLKTYEDVFTSSVALYLPSSIVGNPTVFLVGGGGGGGDVNYVCYTYQISGGGGGGGYTTTQTAVLDYPGQALSISIGTGGSPNCNGGITQITKSGAYITSAKGGEAPFSMYMGIYGVNGYDVNMAGGDGGSGGGSGSYLSWYDTYYRAATYGASDGGNGLDSDGYIGSNGQGRTTRAFGESNGTLYAGGGGGSPGVAGGSGGGGSFRQYGYANTGGGGGGMAWYDYLNEYSWTPGHGGSGICIVRWQINELTSYTTTYSYS